MEELRNKHFQTCTGIYTAMKARFYRRKNKNKNGEYLMYLHVCGNGKQLKLSLGFTVKDNEFDSSTQKIIGKESRHKELQLLLDNVRSKVTAVKTFYWLSNKILTPEKLIEELKNNIPRGEFTSFFEYELSQEKTILKDGTYRRHQSVLMNLRKFKKEIYFSEIDETFLDNYKSYFLKTRNYNTFYSNLKVIKKYLRKASKKGIPLKIDIDTIKIKNIRSNRVALTPEEVKKLYNFYVSEFILPGEKIPIGIFLFSCYTGLRISDLKKLTREQIFTGILEFIPVKTELSKPYMHRVRVNNKALSIVEQVPDLFNRWIAEQNINEVIKRVTQKLNIKKEVSLHVGRHTFATNYLRAGGKVEQLQKLLNHTSIKETMIYVHMVEAEEDESIFLLDNLF